MEHYPESPLTLWFRPPVATNRRRAPLIDPVFLIILIPTLAVVFIFFVLPPLLSHVTSHIIKPGSVKSTWDSLNIFLVLFAILCGLMARRNDDVSSSGDVDCFLAERSDSTVESSGQWVGFDVDMYYIDPTRRIENSNRSAGGVHRRSRRSEEDFSDVKDIVVDTLVVNPNATKFREQALSSSSKRHSFRSVGKNIVKAEVPTNDLDKVIRSHSSPLPLLLPPPTTELKVHRSQHKHKKLERKVSDVATEISSLYNQKKGKNKRNLRNMSPEIVQPRQTPAPPPPPLPPPPSVFKNLFRKGAKQKRIHSVPATVPPPPPPPPPPPRPISIFNNIFKSGSKSMRFHSPSPVPPSSIMNTLFKNGTKSKRFSCINAASSPPPPPPPPPLPPPRYTVKSKQLSTPTLEAQNGRGTSKGKPPLPKKTSGYYERDDFLTSGSQSPLVPVPPPPPPPPFKMSDMKLEVRGDFVKGRSAHSCVCSSPDHDDVDLASIIVGGGSSSIGPDSGLTSFASSPDVNAKAESFISRLKDEWRMEKNNYVKDKMG